MMVASSSQLSSPESSSLSSSTSSSSFLPRSCCSRSRPSSSRRASISPPLSKQKWMAASTLPPALRKARAHQSGGNPISNIWLMATLSSSSSSSSSECRSTSSSSSSCSCSCWWGGGVVMSFLAPVVFTVETLALSDGGGVKEGGGAGEGVEAVGGGGGGAGGVPEVVGGGVTTLSSLLLLEGEGVGGAEGGGSSPLTSSALPSSFLMGSGSSSLRAPSFLLVLASLAIVDTQESSSFPTSPRAKSIFFPLSVSVPSPASISRIATSRSDWNSSRPTWSPLPAKREMEALSDMTTSSMSSPRGTVQASKSGMGPDLTMWRTRSPSSSREELLS
mmetsp:Transcript_29365/g.58568  ORF Transcript_29365/g.58568 Transcript_29365/m.58568 type:complete len:333 (-) Transcript_29365:2322-3320(-)